MKMARMYTKRNEIIALRGAYHGLTFGAATVTGISHYKHGFGPLLAGIHHAMMPYCYRCPLRMEYPDCGAACADDVENTLTCSSAGDVAAMMLEPILGAGGVVIPPSEYFARLTEICRQHSLLLIIDEVQTGFGRSGKMFGFEHFDVHPDVIVFGKVLGGGLALAAVATNTEIASTFRSFPSTLAANALACAAGLKTIEVIQSEKLHEKAARSGKYLEKRLLELAEGSPVIGDVRCRGLMCGIEFVEEKKKPAPDKVLDVIDRLREKGVLSLGAGIYGNVLRIQPPLTITEEQLDTVVERLEEALNEERVNSST